MEYGFLPRLINSCLSLRQISLLVPLRRLVSALFSSYTLENQPLMASTIMQVSPKTTSLLVSFDLSPSSRYMWVPLGSC